MPFCQLLLRGQGSVLAAAAAMEHPDIALAQPLPPPAPAPVEAVLTEVAAAMVAPVAAAAQRAASKRCANGGLRLPHLIARLLHAI